MQTSRRPSSAHRALVLSIHDLSPLTRGRVEVMLDDLAAAGVERTSLLVIPNHHHRAPLNQDPGFCRWLKERQDLGHEIVLHGYHHRRPPVGSGSAAGNGSSSSLRSHLITEHYTAGEGEFFDLSEPEASQLLERGQKDFAEAGLSASGFIAPAWLLGSDAERAVRAAGFSYTTRLRNMKDLESGQEWGSQSLVWSVRSAWRRVLSLAWNATLARSLRGNPLMRIGLHPPDWDHPGIRAQILRLVRDGLAGREAMTYEKWLARSRAQR